MPPTTRLYWLDDHCLEAPACVTGVREGAIAFDQTCFYPGGGGQPPDHGTIDIGAESTPIAGAEAGDDGIVWHQCAIATRAEWQGQAAFLRVDAVRRAALSRYHTVLHVLNTIALRDHGAWITGAQIAVEYARIDFKWEGFSVAACAEVGQKVNAELAADRPVVASSVSEAEFAGRPDLLRTLEVKPPVIDGRVRVVAIEGFDAQACGGTHVRSTGELGRFEITRTENKGRINKRLYIRLS
jgi:misacylated tRNA(Ala) deacylase